MKIIIPLAGYGTRMRPHTWSRAKPLLNVAGNTVIGHLLDLMADITDDELIFVVGYKETQIEDWLREHYPHLTMHFVLQEEMLGQAHAIWMCRDFLGDEPALVAFGDGIVDADYASIADTTADGVCLVQPVENPRKFGVVAVDEQGIVQQFIEKPATDEHKLALAGIYWFRQGKLLRSALETIIRDERMTKGEYYLVDAYQVLLEQGLKIVTKPTRFWFDAGNPENILATNARLLGIGYNSTDAIERSYAEDFTVLPPVYLDPEAEVDGSVIGPYVTIAAGAKVRGSVVRNSIIDEDAVVEDCVLADSLVGQRGQVKGQATRVFVGDDAQIG